MWAEHLNINENVRGQKSFHDKKENTRGKREKSRQTDSDGSEGEVSPETACLF